MIRLGYFLLRQDVQLHCWPERAYRGADRMAGIPNVFEDPPSERPRRAPDALWRAYENAAEEGSIRRDSSLAIEFQQRFLQYGYRLEAASLSVAALPRDDEVQQVAVWPEQLEKLLKTVRAFEPAICREPDQSTFLGFDIAWPTPSFHSAIYQPGLNLLYPHLPERLNQFGLFADLSSARGPFDDALKMHYGPIPFCVLAVSSVKPAGAGISDCRSDDR